MSILSKLIAITLALFLLSCDEKIEMKLIAPGDLASDSDFGGAVAMSNDLLFVGAPGADGTRSRSGAVILYKKADTGWVATGALESLYRDSEMAFGASLDVDNGSAIVGAPLADRQEKDAGIAMIFEQNDEGSWTETARLMPDSIVWNARFGTSVSISGDMAIIGAIFGQTDNEVTGAAYIFSRQQDGSWIQTDRLQPSMLNYDDRFGSSVAISGNIAIVGSPNDDEKSKDAGATYIFEKQSDDSWKETAKLAPAGDGSLFGYAVSISDDKIAVGAHWYLTEGVVFIFERKSDGSWVETALLQPTNESFPSSNNDRFGYSVDILQNRVLVGAPWGANPEGTHSGVAWFFEKDEEDNWSDGVQISATEDIGEAYFGATVNLSSNHLVIGAPGTDDNKGAVVVAAQ